MERPSTSSRVPTPAIRTYGNTAMAPAKRGSGGGNGSATGSAASLQPPPFGLRRPSAGAAHTSPPPRLALYELQNGATGTVPLPPPTSTATYLKRGSGRTIATLGNPAVAMTPPPPSATRRKSGSPRRDTATTLTPVKGTQLPPTTNATPLRTRHGSRDAAVATERIPTNKMLATTTANEYGTMPTDQVRENQQQQSTPLSPETYLRQRKRSADMMDPQDPAFLLSAPAASAPSPDEVDEPPMRITDGSGAMPNELAAGPMTPPPRVSGAHESSVAGAIVPMSPRDSKRQRRQTRSPKTPLGLSNYETEEGGLSATQRVRLSLSGFMTVASLTGVGSVRRESGTGAIDSGRLLANGNGASATDTQPSTASRDPGQAPRSSPTRLHQSTASLARSKFAASRSKSGPAQIASALLQPTNAVNCLMGYVRELQRSEATTRVQLETLRKQRHDELSRSTVRVTVLEKTITQVEREREREQRQLEAQQRMIEMLKAEVADLQAHYYQNGTATHSQSNDGQTLYTENDTTPHDPNDQHGRPWADSNAVSNDHGYIAESLPASSYVTPPPSGSEGRPYVRTPQVQHASEAERTAYYEHGIEPTAVANGGDAALVAGPPTEWTGEPAAYFQSSEGYDPSQEYSTSTMPPTDESGYPHDQGEWPAPHASYNGQGFYPYAHHPDMASSQHDDPPTPWADHPAQHPEQAYDGGDPSAATGSYEAYTAMEPPTAPMSPVAKLDTSWSPQGGQRVQPPVELPPPMFRVAPRLSDIISPLSRSVIAAPVTTDHNVLTPVTPQALANGRQPRGHETAHSVADHAFMMTPPALGPPAFSMSGFHSGSEREATPPPASKPKRQSTGIVPNAHTHAIPDFVPGQEEQFVPAEQVFKPFHKPKTPIRKASITPTKAAPLSRELLKAALVEFFTAVDKTKLRMVEGYSRRYQGEEAKLLNDLTKKYGAQKVAPLKSKLENASTSAAPSSLPPIENPEPSVQAAFMPPDAAPSPIDNGLLSTQELGTHAGFGQAEAETAPPPSGQQLHHISGAASTGVLEPVPIPRSEVFGEVAMHHEPTVGSMAPPPPSVATMEIVPPPPPPAATATTSPRQKVSPNSTRRGPPLPFAFDGVEHVSSDEGAGAEMLPRPQVSVAAPPTMLPPTLSLRSLSAAAPSSPSRLAPSPPRVPPPSERSPPRNASVLRQRVSPQRQPQLPSSSLTRPLPSPSTQPPRPLSLGAISSPPPPNPTPVTLESLLLEFYRKHQPDRLKNVPEVVKQYTGKERELITLLKKKYGALSIKRLEQNLVLLEQQSVVSSMPTTTGNPSKSSTAETTKTNEKTPKARGCCGRMLFFLLKLVLIRVVVTLVLFGGLVALDHAQCQPDPADDDSVGRTDACQSMAHDVESFQLSRLTEYVQRVESRACFCDEWRRREARVTDEPSVASAVDLVKIVPFSRTIAEPAWLQFVDAYLPNLPYSEYYQSYAKPVVRVGKEYAVIGFTQAKDTYTEAVARLPELPWHEFYETHGKPLIVTGREHAVIVYHEVSSRVMALPWAEYYASYGKPAIEWAGEYARIGLEHAYRLSKDVSVLVADQWTMLVEMYNEEGTESETSLSVETPAVDEATDVGASVDALTKAAKASKALAEPHEHKEKDLSLSTGATDERTASHEVKAESSIDDPVVDGAETARTTDAPVEVVVEQMGMEVSYSSAVSTEHSVDSVVVADERTTDLDEVTDSSLSGMATIEATITAIEHDVQEAPAVRTEGDQRVSSESHADVAKVGDNHATHADAATPDIQEAKVDVVEEEVHSKVAELDDVAEAPQPTDLAQVDNLVAELEEPNSDDADDKPVSAETEEANDATMRDDLLFESRSVDIDTVPPVEVKTHDMVEHADLEVVISAGTDNVNTVSETAVAAEAERAGVVEDNTAEKVDTRTDAEPTVGEEEADVALLSRDQEATGLPDAATKQEASTTSASAEKTDSVDETEEDLSFLEDTSGLDPLELLDLADLAAAELHSINERNDERRGHV